MRNPVTTLLFWAIFPVPVPLPGLPKPCPLPTVCFSQRSWNHVLLSFPPALSQFTPAPRGPVLFCLQTLHCSGPTKLCMTISNYP